MCVVAMNLFRWVGMIGVLFFAAGQSHARSNENSAAFTATQLIRQFTLKNTVAQVSQGMQGYVREVNGEMRALPGEASPAGFPGDMSAVPTSSNLPKRDGAGRPLGYCAWDNSTTSPAAGFLAGQGVINPLVFAVVSPGLNGSMETSCAAILSQRSAQGDDYIQYTAPYQASSRHFKAAVSTLAQLQSMPGEENDIRLVTDNNQLYSYTGGQWVPIGNSKFVDDSVAGGPNAIAYTAGKVTVGDFMASTVTLTDSLTGVSAAFSGTLSAGNLTGSGAGLTDLNASNISSGILAPAYGGTGVDSSAASAGSLLIGNGSGFTLGQLAAGAGIAVVNGAGAITISNTGVLSVSGTANQITTSAGNGDIVLSLPQDISTSSVPTFGGMMLNGTLGGTDAMFSGVVSARRLLLSDGSGGVVLPNVVIGVGALDAVQSGVGGNTAIGTLALKENTSGSLNTGVGYSALQFNTTGSDNVAVGVDALQFNTTGSQNSALGMRSLFVVSTGERNVGVGLGAGASVTTGGNNTFLGSVSDALQSDLNYATALGAGALVGTSDTVVLGRVSDTTVIGSTGVASSGILLNKKLQVTGNVGITGNVEIGGTFTAAAFSGNGSGLTNLNASNVSSGMLGTAFGGTGVNASAAGNGQLLIGNGAGFTLRTLTAGTGIGVVNGAGTITISNNGVTSLAGTVNQINVSAATGAVTLSLPQNIATSSTPTFAGLTVNGNAALQTLTVANGITLNSSLENSATNNVIRSLAGHVTIAAEGAVDIIADNNNNNPDSSLALRIGRNDQTTLGSNYTSLLTVDQMGNLSSTSATFSGDLTARRLIVSDPRGVASPNVIVGANAMSGTQSGVGANTAVGLYALRANTTGAFNVAVGAAAAGLATASNELTAVGHQAAGNATASESVALGSYALFNSQGLYNVALGNNSMSGLTTGLANTVVGHYGMIYLSSGNSNIAIGHRSGNDLTSGNANVLIGDIAAGGMTSGEGNVAIGQATLVSPGLFSATALGYNANVTTSNTVVLGKAGNVTVIGATGRGETGVFFNKILQVTGNAGVSGNIVAGGSVSASAFIGDGSDLTNLNASNFTTGTMPVARGGTGLGSTPLNGQLLIGNGTGYTLRTLTAGTGIGVTNGAGTITLSNTGVTSLAGTANQVNVSASTGAITLSLPQSIATTSAPTFGGLTLSGNMSTSGDVTISNSQLRFNNVLGDKIHLFSTTYGLGIQSNNLTAFVPDGARFSVRNSGLSTGEEVFTVSSTGNATFSGKVNATHVSIADYATNLTNPNIIVGLGAMSAGAKSGLGGNTAVGYRALQFSTTGSDNVAVGSLALVVNSSGIANTAVGNQALRNNSGGDSNTALGNFALLSNDLGNSNTAVGYRALANNQTTSFNVAVGWNALENVTSAGRNVGVGGSSLRQSTGNLNTAVGQESGASIVGGFNNVFLGAFADGGPEVSFSAALGYNAKVYTDSTTVVGALATTVVIGSNGAADAGNLVGGKLQVTGSIRASGAVYGTSHPTYSDIRLKTDIQKLDNATILDRLGKLNAYSYLFTQAPGEGRKIGVIAQEIVQLFPEVAQQNAAGIYAVDYGALGALAAAGVGQLSTQVTRLDKTVIEHGQQLKSLDIRVGENHQKLLSLEGWRGEANTRMDNLQTAIDLNIEKIASHAVAIQTNKEAIARLDDVVKILDQGMRTNTDEIGKINSRWNSAFSAASDGSVLTVIAPELKAGNFSAQQIQTKSLYTQRLEAEMARIADLEVNHLRANQATARVVRAEEMNTGSVQVYASLGSPAYLFTAPRDGHYTVNTSALDGSYATATVIVNAGQAKIISIASEGIELLSEGNVVKASAAGKAIKASWIKMG